jgi:hypothetical protein
MIGFRVALDLGRVSNLPTVWTNVLAGIMLSGATGDAGVFAAALLSMSLMYVAGMFLNDAFDAEIDARQRPGRPIPSGRVAARSVFAYGYAMLALGLLLMASMGAAAFGAAALLAALVVFYNYHHKANPYSPLVMGMCRMLTYVASAFAATGGADLPLPVIQGALVLLADLIGLTYVAKQEERGRLGKLWPVAGVACPLVAACLLMPVSAWTVLCLLLSAAWTVHCLMLVRAGNMRHAVGGLIAGISLADALAFSFMGWSPQLALASAAFLLTLVLQRKIAGT